jgi:hypothetical protein
LAPGQRAPEAAGPSVRENCSSDSHGAKVSPTLSFNGLAGCSGIRHWRQLRRSDPQFRAKVEQMQCRVACCRSCDKWGLWALRFCYGDGKRKCHYDVRDVSGCQRESDRKAAEIRYSENGWKGSIAASGLPHANLSPAVFHLPSAPRPVDFRGSVVDMGTPPSLTLKVAPARPLWLGLGRGSAAQRSPPTVALLGLRLLADKV